MSKGASRKNYVRNFSFEKRHGDIAEDWYMWYPRAELAPKAQVKSNISHSGKWSFWMCGEGGPSCYGLLGQTIGNVGRGKSYHFKVYFKTTDVKSIHQSVIVQLSWIAAESISPPFRYGAPGSREVDVQYISELKAEGDWKILEGCVTSPEEANTLEIELIFRWSEGSIWWDDVELVGVPPPKRRKIRLSTVYFKPKAPTTVEGNLDAFTRLLDVAGKGGADIVCLPEAITYVGVGKSEEDVAETIPGPATARLAEKAKLHKMYVVASLYERVGDVIYNTAVLIDRAGKVIGKYRKTHLPHGEHKNGITPGDAYPVFETDFGKVGLEICYDIFFPEITRILALQGAVIVLLPIWGCWFHYGQESWYVTARSRALDNNVFLIASMYDRHSLIVGSDGGILANSEGKEGVFFAEIELVDKKPKPTYVHHWPGVNRYEWGQYMPKDRRPETYASIVEYE